VRIISLAGYSTPIFWVGMMGLLLFYAWLGWVGGAGRLDLGLEGSPTPHRTDDGGCAAGRERRGVLERR